MNTLASYIFGFMQRMANRIERRWLATAMSAIVLMLWLLFCAVMTYAKLKA